MGAGGGGGETAVAPPTPPPFVAATRLTAALRSLAPPVPGLDDVSSALTAWMAAAGGGGGPEYGAALDAGDPAHPPTAAPLAHWSGAAGLASGGSGSASQAAGSSTTTPADVGAMFASSLQSVAARAAAAPAPPSSDSDDPLAPKQPAQKPLGALWLRDWLVAAAGGAADGDMAAAVARAVLTATSPDALAADLLDLLGEAAFPAIQDLLAVRKRLDSGLRAQIGAARAAGAAAPAGPLAPTVTIATAGERAAERAARKAARRVARGAATAGGDADAAWVAEFGMEGLADDEAATPGPDFVAAPGAAPARDARTALPAGTVRIVKKGYEELRVPPPAAAPRDEPLVPVDRLPPWARAAFAGYTHLNRIQSRIFPAAFTTGVNLLVCAPTGAGKTNIAMLAVLREVSAVVGRRGGDGGTGQSSSTLRPPSAADFKVVYVAPMKALAAEVTAAFSKRLRPLGLAVRELTGDMQLTRRELAATHMIVTTPEKWDVVTRKGGEGGSTAAAVRLLIIDEVHLLNDDRGAVVETLVARTHRCVEAAQRAIRVVGLSATLPNHRDVASFLGAPPAGVFHFDATFRPVPLETAFVGVHARAVAAARAAMDDIAFDKVLDSVRRGHQAMVFVHSRKDTGRVARALAQAAAAQGVADAFSKADHPRAAAAARDLAKSRNRELQEVAASGFGLHHAGMLRGDRSLVERLFADGHLSVLVCTATLAWGVNLPAHTVVIRGTQLYNPSKGGFTNLGMLDVQQIFGRAGRPQFDVSGEAVIITPHDTLAHYLGLLTHAVPIESRLVPVLADALNAEAVLGSVASIADGARWLAYTYLAVRMARNPLAYGIPWAELSVDPALEGRRRALIAGAAAELEAVGMARVDAASGALAPTDLGRTASHYYVSVATVRVFNERLKPGLGEADLLAALARASEFENVAVREEEGAELDALARDACPFDTGAAAAAAAKASTSGGGGANKPTGPTARGRKGDRKAGAGGGDAGDGDEPPGASLDRAAKVNILLQAYISRARVDSFSLTADLNYVASNAPRLCRAAFDVCVRRGWPAAAETALALSTAFERRAWPHDHPLWQLESRRLSADVLRGLDAAGATLDVLAGASAADVGAMLRHPAAGAAVVDAVTAFPHVSLAARLQPLTPSILRLTLTITPAFRWTDAVHGGGGALKWHVWVEDGGGEALLAATTWSLPRATALARTPTDLAIMLPLTSPPPPTLCVRLLADAWLGAAVALPLSLRALPLPGGAPTPRTPLPPLPPLPRTALAWPAAEAVLPFAHFNAVQTAAFHALYHGDASALLAAPAGCGTAAALEIALLRALRPRLLAAGKGGDGGGGGGGGGGGATSSGGGGALRPPHKTGTTLYLTSIPALAAKRAADWRARLGAGLGATVLAADGDAGLPWGAVVEADLVVATPAAWAACTRAIPDAAVAATLTLVLVDAVHMVGVGEAGSALEGAVTRLHIAAARAGAPLRVVAAAAPAPNVADVAAWLGAAVLLNCGPGARPVPLDVHVQGFPGAHAAPRAAAMTRPAYAAIRAHAPAAPAIVFVSSRRQVRLTVVDLIACAAGDDAAGGGFTGTAAPAAADAAAAAARDPTLRHALAFGVGVLHGGLSAADAGLVARLFEAGAIRVIVATHDAAWAAPALRARLVVVKGTDAYDATADAYVEIAPAAVEAMVARAGRAGVDDRGVAVVMAAADAKPFVKAFLAAPPPIESGAWGAGLPDWVLGVVAAGAAPTRQGVVDALTWTLAARRAAANPAYYGLEAGDGDAIGAHLCALAEGALRALQAAGCVDLPAPAADADGARPIALTPAGAAAVAHGVSAATVAGLVAAGPAAGHFRGVADAVAAAVAAAAPRRHSDDATLPRLAPRARWGGGASTAAKSLTLLQAHLARAPWPGPDAAADARSVATAAARAAAAALDLAAARGDGGGAVAAAALRQCVLQAAWPDDAAGGQVDGVSRDGAAALAAATPPGARLPSLPRDTVAAALASVGTSPRTADAAVAAVGRLPDLRVAFEVTAADAGGGCTLRLDLQRRAGAAAAAPPLHAATPRWPGLLPEAWHVLAVDAGGRLLAAQRVPGAATSVTLPVAAPTVPARPLDVYIIADTYVGLDARCVVPARAGVGVRGRGDPWSAAAAAAVGLDQGPAPPEAAAPPPAQAPVDADDDDADDAPAGLG